MIAGLYSFKLCTEPWWHRSSVHTQPLSKFEKTEKYGERQEAEKKPVNIWISFVAAWYLDTIVLKKRRRSDCPALNYQQSYKAQPKQKNQRAFTLGANKQYQRQVERNDEPNKRLGGFFLS